MISTDPKYIIFDNGLDDIAIVFPNAVQHATIEDMMGSWAARSAGFVRIGADGQCVAHGESLSLKLKSQEEDSKILTKMLKAGR